MDKRGLLIRSGCVPKETRAVSSPDSRCFCNGGEFQNLLLRSKEVEAFTQDWAGQEFLWCNPPFTMMDEVVRKIDAEGAEVLLVLP